MRNLAVVTSLFLAGALLASGCSTKPVTTTVIGIKPDGGTGGPRDGGMMTGTLPNGMDPKPASCPSTAPMPRKAAGDSCVCDIECATGTCQGGVCCAGMACATRKPLGVSCENNSQCQSNYCADGVCCNVACTGACVSCNQPDQMGECAPVPAGSEDMHGVCRKDSPETCGQSGYCNGQGGCAKFAAGTVCVLSTCDTKARFIPASLCDGEGTCVKGVALSCAPSTCEAGACLSSCTGNDKCMAPSSCVNGSCGPKGIGQDCTAGTQCGSGFCVDGVCCDTACTGKCFFCASPEARGKCQAVKANVVDQRAARGEKDPAKICAVQDPATCGTDGRCDGKGGCQKYKDNTPCAQARCDGTANTQTAAGVCTGGSCRVPAARSCAPFRGCSGNACRGSCSSDAQCSSGNVCTATSCGKKPNGAICTANGECTSNVCAQGRCCAGACNATCRSCAVPGQEGSCVNVAVGAADPAGVCRDDACSNGCDGNGGCRREPVDSTCGAPSCASGSQQVIRTCNAAGMCETRNVSCAMGFMCMGGSCVASPKKNGEPCVANAECESKICSSNNICCGSKCDGECKQCMAGTGNCVNRDGSCGGGGSCTGGICCQPGLTNCGGVCRNLETDEANCGSCGMSCGNLTCLKKMCTLVCAEPLLKCGNACVDVDTDVENCGSCGHRCPMGATCTNKTCGCPASAPFDCNGVCKACCETCNECEKCSGNGKSCDPDDSRTCGGSRVCCNHTCCPVDNICSGNGNNRGCTPIVMMCMNCTGECKQCNTMTGVCGNKADGTDCSTGACDAGACKPRMCMNCGGECKQCDTVTGNCGNKADGTDCSTGACDGGACKPRTCMNCGGECKQCNTVTGNCGDKPDGTDCSTGACDGGACKPRMCMNCGGECKQCNTVTGNCGDKPDGTDCSTGGCDGGACKPRMCMNCGGECKQCNTVSGECGNVANDTPCAGGACQGGACVPSMP